MERKGGKRGRGGDGGKEEEDGGKGEENDGKAEENGGEGEENNEKRKENDEKAEDFSGRNGGIAEIQADFSGRGLRPPNGRNDKGRLTFPILGFKRK